MNSPINIIFGIPALIFFFLVIVVILLRSFLELWEILSDETDKYLLIAMTITVPLFLIFITMAYLIK